MRAQLARIAASTVLCPAGYFTANEEGGLDKAEEFIPPAATDLATMAAWAHRYPHLKKQGMACLSISTYLALQTKHHCHVHSSK